MAGAALAGIAAHAGAQPTDGRRQVRRRRISAPPVFTDLSSWTGSGLYAAWLGHSTVLLKIDGFTILTDPILSNRAGMDLRVCTVGVRRRVAPPLTFETLPPIDLILLSHAHMDHFDIPSLRRLRSPQTTIITAPFTTEFLRPRRYREVRELAWGESARCGPAVCKAFEVNHWGARYRSDTFRGYNGYTIEAGRHRVVFAGDTAMTGAFRSLRSSRRFDLAIMPIGAYNPMIHNHCTPEQAWRMTNDAGAERILPVHHQTFRLSFEPYFEPIERLQTAAGSQSSRIAVRRIGEHVHLA
jgi:L-ascorbate metabolism protein UlaG (beta-lactamase superfamily)